MTNLSDKLVGYRTSQETGDWWQEKQDQRMSPKPVTYALFRAHEPRNCSHSFCLPLPLMCWSDFSSILQCTRHKEHTLN